jgi:hypothetical protein
MQSFISEKSDIASSAMAKKAGRLLLKQSFLPGEVLFACFVQGFSGLSDHGKTRTGLT